MFNNEEMHHMFNNQEGTINFNSTKQITWKKFMEDLQKSDRPDKFRSAKVFSVKFHQITDGDTIDISDLLKVLPKIKTLRFEFTDEYQFDKDTHKTIEIVGELPNDNENEIDAEEDSENESKKGNKIFKPICIESRCMGLILVNHVEDLKIYNILNMEASCLKKKTFDCKNFIDVLKLTLFIDDVKEIVFQNHHHLKEFEIHTYNLNDVVDMHFCNESKDNNINIIFEVSKESLLSNVICTLEKIQNNQKCGLFKKNIKSIVIEYDKSSRTYRKMDDLINFSDNIKGLTAERSQNLKQLCLNKFLKKPDILPVIIPKDREKFYVFKLGSYDTYLRCFNVDLNGMEASNFMISIQQVMSHYSPARISSVEYISISNPNYKEIWDISLLKKKFPKLLEVRFRDIKHDSRLSVCDTAKTNVKVIVENIECVLVKGDNNVNLKYSIEQSTNEMPLDDMKILNFGELCGSLDLLISLYAMPLHFGNYPDVCRAPYYSRSYFFGLEYLNVFDTVNIIIDSDEEEMGIALYVDEHIKRNISIKFSLDPDSYHFGTFDTVFMSLENIAKCSGLLQNIVDFTLIDRHQKPLIYSRSIDEFSKLLSEYGSGIAESAMVPRSIAGDNQRIGSQGQSIQRTSNKSKSNGSSEDEYRSKFERAKELLMKKELNEEYSKDESCCPRRDISKYNTQSSLVKEKSNEEYSKDESFVVIPNNKRESKRQEVSDKNVTQNNLTKLVIILFTFVVFALLIIFYTSKEVINI